MLTYEELWRTRKNNGSKLPEDHYRDQIENFILMKALFVEVVRIARQL